jgi:cytochrome c oxidase cbb3-type subunit III
MLDNERRQMSRRSRTCLGIAGILLAAAATLVAAKGSAQSDDGLADPGGLGGVWRRVPVTHLSPGGTVAVPDIKNPMAGDPDSADRGRQYFDNFNCIGCHAPNGGGGMGPSLSNDTWIYGSRPANIYLTIVQGRPNGMPSFGNMLSDQIVWDLVSYVQSIAQKPGSAYGSTTSLSPQSPKIQQVPAEMIETTTPWDHTEPFGNGQRPPTVGSK